MALTLKAEGGIRTHDVEYQFGKLVPSAAWLLLQVLWDTGSLQGPEQARLSNLV